MSYTRDTFPGKRQSAMAGAASHPTMTLARSRHQPFVLLPGVTGTAHTLFKDPYKTLFDQTTYDALAVKPLLIDVPETGLLLELNASWHSDKTASTGITTAPVLHLFGLLPPPSNHPRNLGNIDAIEGAQVNAAPTAPYDKGIFVPLMTVSSSSSSTVTIPTTNAMTHVGGSFARGWTEPVQIYLTGVPRVCALLETAAVVDDTAASTCHIMGRVIDF